jgi:hypothetical protein
MKRILLAIEIALISCFLVLSGCGGGGGGGTAGGDNGNGGNTAQTMLFKTYSYVDSNGIGTEAFRMLVPSDWIFTGGITWSFDNPGAPAAASFEVKNPNGNGAFQLLSAQSFFSTEDPSVLYIFPIGTKYYGNEVRPYPPLGSIKTLENIIVPRFRGSVTNVQIVSEQTLTDVGDLLRAGLPAQQNTTLDAGKIRIEYMENSMQMEEEIYCVIESTTFKTFNYYNNTLWMADFLFSFKAQKGSLDTQYKLFQTMMYSFRVNPEWFNKYVQLINYLVLNQIQVIQSYGQLSQIISQTSNDISDMMWQSYNDRNAAEDRMAEDFSNYMLGTDTYYDPIDQGTVKLPSGYSDAWVNGLGEYVLSNDVNYDPNVNSGQNWQKMQIQ